MTAPSTVLIAPLDLLPVLKQRASDVSADQVLAFSDADALLALEAIIEHRPRVVALERLFAATPRGGALINRIKADPSLTDSEIRIVSDDGEFARVSQRRTGEGGPSGSTAVAAAPATAAKPAVTTTSAAATHPLDQRGTRRSRRYGIAGTVEVLIDGNTATLVDLSTDGAQVVSLTILKPNQRVRMTLPDDMGTVRFNGQVAWASFEIPPKTGPRYRAGLEFVDADASAVDAFCIRHRKGE